jgi:prepilin-type N-terminal cleavage/methylation domain-containing protein
MTRRAGITLLELIVVLAIMGIMAAVVGLAVRQPEPPLPATSLEAARAAVADARREAMRTGQPVAVTVSIDAGSRRSASAAGTLIQLHATAAPDGSVIADTALRIDRLSGRPHRGGPR